ncbi:arginine--tRNA ligase [Candidatus Micrarchaeota archaeon]|nr:arginine--tRNA ligase [Candidatus Micrarchaeota archaeon]
MIIEIKEELAKIISKNANVSFDDALASLEGGKVGDLSSKIAFVLAKEKKANPALLAHELAAKLAKAKPDTIEEIESTGPYVNFYLSPRAYASIINEILEAKDHYGSSKNNKTSKNDKAGKSKTKKEQPEKKGKVLIEFPSVNPNKPWHIGHLRNALLGDSVARILEFDGYVVERMDYIDDLGLQVAQSLWGFLNYDSNPHGKFDQWLGEQYVGVAKKFEDDKTVVDGVRDVLKLMEEGNNEVSNAGRSMAEKCVLAQYETAFMFNIYHDVLIFESDILQTIFEEGMDLIKQSGSVIRATEGKNTGCWVVQLSPKFEEEFGKMDNPQKVLIRSDGTAVYTGKDVIFHLWKLGKLKNDFLYEEFTKQPNGKTAYKSSVRGKKMQFAHADRAINVIGVEQKYPQRVIVEVLRTLNFKEAECLHHLSYEHVGLPDEKFSGRKGTWIGFTTDELAAEAQSRTMEKIKLDGVGEKEKKDIARIVGIGAIKFSFLKSSSDKRITFKWEEALSLEGDSGPYMQYAYVRTNGIFSKTKEKEKVSEIKFNDSERKLLKDLASFGEIVTRSSKELAPHHICQYALSVAAAFSSFYANSPVIAESDESVRRTRLAIAKATSIVLKNALGLLGIECPERM